MIHIVYVALIHETMDSYHIKIGRSENRNTLASRIQTYRTICPDVKLLASNHLPQKYGEQYILEEMRNKGYKCIGKELFKVFKINTKEFVSDILHLLRVDGHDNQFIHFYELTGCQISHYKKNYLGEHENCSDKCLHKIQLEREKRQAEIVREKHGIKRSMA